MIVFKAFFKILKQNYISILLYLVIFVAIAIVFSTTSDRDPMEFSHVKTDIAFYDHDNTPLTQGLKTYLNEYVNFKEIDPDAIEDAFFYRDVEVIIEIPKGFSQSLEAGEHLSIHTKSVPDSPTSFTVMNQINKYLKFAEIYLNHDLPTENIHESIMNHLTIDTTTSLVNEEQTNFDFVYFFYNYMAYILLALILTVVGSIMATFKPIEIQRRNRLGYPSNKFNSILIFANTLLGIAFLIILTIVAFILFGFETMVETRSLLIILNAFLFTITTIALAYLLATLFKSKEVIGALGTVFSLGFSFITGIFIPQELLNGTLLKFAQFIPSYWYINGNNRIASLHQFNQTTLTPIVSRYFIQIAFTIVFVLISLLVSRRQQQSEL